jgi:hypothetical protein
MANATYKLNDKVEALYYKGSTWYKGKIQAVHTISEAEFVYDVAYDDGDRELKVPESNIRLFGGASTPTPTTAKATFVSPTPVALAVAVIDSKKVEPVPGAMFKVGDKVEGLYGGGPSWYGAVVAKVNALEAGGRYSYQLDYNDGDRENSVGETHVRLVAAAVPADIAANSRIAVLASAAPLYRTGSRVQGYFEDVDSWYDGAVERVNADGTYHVIYDDGDEDRTASEERLRAPPASQPESASTAAVSPRPVAAALPSPIAPAKYAKGDRIEGRFGGDSEWYAGVVSAVVRVDKSFVYNLSYDDGDYEENIESEFIRPLLLASTTAPSHSPTPVPTGAAATTTTSTARKPSVVNTNLDSFLNDLSDDEEEEGGSQGGVGGLDSGRGVMLRTAGGVGEGPSASIEKTETEDDGYDEDFDA